MIAQHPTQSATAHPARRSGRFTGRRRLAALLLVALAGLPLLNVAPPGSSAAGQPLPLQAAEPDPPQMALADMERAAAGESARLAGQDITPCLAPAEPLNVVSRTVAFTGQVISNTALTAIYDGFSMNGAGRVAFVGASAQGEAIYAGARYTDTRKINPQWESANRIFNETVSIADDGSVIARDRLAGAPPATAIRIWDSQSAQPNTYRKIDEGYGDRTVIEPVAINNTGGYVYGVLAPGMRLLQFASGSDTINWSGVIYPSLSDSGKAAVHYGPDATSPIKLVSGGFGFNTLIAGPDDFMELGRRPAGGADDTVAFYGYLNYVNNLGNQPDVGGFGPGIFLSYLQGGQRRLLRLAGVACNGQLDPGEHPLDLNGDGAVQLLEDEGAIRSFVPDGRIALNLDRSGDAVYAAFLAHDVAGLALFTVRLPWLNGAPNRAGLELRRVVGVGDRLAGQAGTVVGIVPGDRLTAGGAVAALLTLSDNRQVLLRYDRQMHRPLLIVPGIAGTGPAAGDFTWWVQRGVHINRMRVDPMLGVYDDLIQTLCNQGYELNRDLFLVNYDWRLSPADYDGRPDGVIEGFTAEDMTKGTFVRGVDYFGYVLKQAALVWRQEHPGEPDLDAVDVVAHSTGGLVTRTYLQSTAYGGTLTSVQPPLALPRVHNFVMVGVPNFGSAKAWNALQDNWVDDLSFMLVLSKFLAAEYAYIQSNPFHAIFGPPADIYSSTLTGDPQFSREQNFILQYVPTIRALLATYPFMRRVPNMPLQTTQESLIGRLFTNWLAIDLNGGQTAPGQAIGLSPRLTGRLTAVVGAHASTPLIVEMRQGPSQTCLDRGLSQGKGYFTNADLAPFSSFIGRCANPNESWWKLLRASDEPVPGMDFDMGGDGTVAYGSSAGFVRREQEAYPDRARVYEYPGVLHLNLMFEQPPQEGILRGLDVDLAALGPGAISTNRHKSELGALQEAYLNGILSPYNPAGLLPAERAAYLIAYQTLRAQISKLRFGSFLFDPVAGYVTDGQGRRLGQAPSQGAQAGIPYSTWVGDGEGSGVGFVIGPALPPTLTFDLRGLNAPYAVQAQLYAGDVVTGTEAGGALLGQGVSRRVLVTVTLPPPAVYITPTAYWIAPAQNVTAPVYGRLVVQVAATSTQGIDGLQVFFDVDGSGDLTDTHEIMDMAPAGGDVYRYTFPVLRGPPGRRDLAVLATSPSGMSVILTRTLLIVPPVGPEPAATATPTPKPTLTPEPTASPTPTPSPIPTATPAPGCIGDFTGPHGRPDGAIQVDDVQAIAFRWDASSGQPNYQPQYDLNRNGRIDANDVQTVAGRWNTTCRDWPSRRAEPGLVDAGRLITLALPAGPYAAGVPITAEVWVDGARDLGAYELTLAYPAGQVAAGAVSAGPFAASTGRAFVLLPPAVDAAAGQLTFAAFSLGDAPAGATGSGLLARVQWIPQQAVAALPLTLAGATLADTRGNRLLPPSRIFLPLVNRPG